MATKQKAYTFPILKLPSEVRVRICEYTAVDGDPIHIKKRTPVPHSLLRSGKRIHVNDEHRVATSRSRLALAFTGQQLYMEMTPIYYSKNWFLGNLVSRDAFRVPVHHFLHAIWAANALYINKVCLTVQKEFICDISEIGVPRRRGQVKLLLFRAFQCQVKHFQEKTRVVVASEGKVALELKPYGTEFVAPGEDLPTLSKDSFGES